MRSEQAPLYVKTYDLARYLLERTAHFPKNRRFTLARRIEEAILELLELVTLALLSREGRSERLHKADEAVTRIRLAVRLSRDLELLRKNQAEFVFHEISEIGNMLGGWQRQQGLSHADP